MVSAKKCDICGSFYIPENYSSHRIKIIIDSARPYDLCDECQHNLEVFAKLTPDDSQISSLKKQEEAEKIDNDFKINWRDLYLT